MNEPEVVILFEDLRQRYPMAAAGLIEQLCSNLSMLLESETRDENAIATSCETIARCFRPMDTAQFPNSYPWDAAYAVFGRWLVRGLPQYVAAVKTITAWSDSQFATCRSRYIDMVRANQEDWNRALDMLDRQNIR